MGDPTKFQYLYEYYAFNVSLLLLVISEIVIYVCYVYWNMDWKTA